MDVGLPRVERFSEFWPIYLREHARPATRYVHYAGTTAGLACLGLALVTGRRGWIPLGLVAAYGAAWTAHGLVERNKPATFQHPLWSLAGDLRMLWFAARGKLDGELRRAGVS
jgi:hypothetical protein